MNERLAYPVEIIAKLLTITPRRVQQLANENVITKTARGQYDLIKSVQGYIDYLNNQIPHKSNTGESGAIGATDLIIEQTKLTRHKAEIERMKAQEMSGLLVEKAAERKYAFRLARIARNNVLNLPAQLSVILATELDADKTYRILRSALIEALAEIKPLAEQDEQQRKWPHDTECYHWHWHQ